jgi:hypothetical protein
MVLLMYLEDDDPVVEKLMQDSGLAAYSRLPLEGHGSGAGGWYGDVAAYRSGMIFALVTSQEADRLLQAVDHCTGCADPAHPIHAIQLDIEKSVTSSEAHKRSIRS